MKIDMEEKPLSERREPSTDYKNDKPGKKSLL